MFFQTNFLNYSLVFTIFSIYFNFYASKTNPDLNFGFIFNSDFILNFY